MTIERGKTKTGRQVYRLRYADGTVSDWQTWTPEVGLQIMAGAALDMVADAMAGGVKKRARA